METPSSPSQPRWAEHTHPPTGHSISLRTNNADVDLVSTVAFVTSTHETSALAAFAQRVFARVRELAMILASIAQQGAG